MRRNTMINSKNKGQTILFILLFVIGIVLLLCISFFVWYMHLWGTKKELYYFVHNTKITSIQKEDIYVPAKVIGTEIVDCAEGMTLCGVTYHLDNDGKNSAEFEFNEISDEFGEHNVTVCVDIDKMIIKRVFCDEMRDHFPGSPAISEQIVNLNALDCRDMIFNDSNSLIIHYKSDYISLQEIDDNNQYSNDFYVINMDDNNLLVIKEMKEE